MSNTEQTSRYSVGIDLGTTHSVISLIDLTDDEDQCDNQILEIPQLTKAGQIEKLKQLPSFIYLPHPDEFSTESLTLPWEDSQPFVVGAMARTAGIKTPLRLISSAKSWLCHPSINPETDFLPLNSPAEVPHMSPASATKAYLTHLKQAWDQQFPDAPLEKQQITLTVPASFNPAARELTVKNAKACDFNYLTLLEEPQSALYSWLEVQGEQWRNTLKVGDCLLVVDIGGGTTDFSLIKVSEEEGNLQLNRVAVGDHILLGGDNMDLALAYRVRAKLAAEGKSLQPWQIFAITQSCRDAKERLLDDASLEAVPIVVPSRGSSLLGGSLRTELTQVEVQETLVEGFFPKSEITELPKQSPRSALAQKGLPYVQDPAITHHLAAFLTKQHAALFDDGAGEKFSEEKNAFAQPTALLINGGVLKSKTLSQRLISIINNWLASAGAEEVTCLEGNDLDLAVGKGAAYFGKVKQGQGVRIKGGIASSYYVGVESTLPAIPGMAPPMEALCIAPFGMEEGSSAEIESETFGLVVGEPVQFRFFGSTTRRNDQTGDRLDEFSLEGLEELPEIQALLPAGQHAEGEMISIRLSAHITEVGTLQLSAIAVDSDEHWNVEFDVRKIGEALPEQELEEA
jgi:hypothetical protein